MANVKISQLPSLSTMTDASEIPVVSSGTTYKITGSTLEVYFTGNVEFAGTTLQPRAGATESNITLKNGTSAVDILAANGNVAVTAGANTWTFGTNGITTFPTGGLISNYLGIAGANGDSWFITPGGAGTGGVSSQDGQQYIQINNNLFVEIGTSFGTANASAWRFGLDGTFAAPGNISTTGNVIAGNLDAVNLVINRISSDDSTFVTIADGVNVTGEIAATGNITGNYFVGNGSQLTGISNANIGNITFVNTTMSAPAGDDIVIRSINSDDDIINSELLMSPGDTWTRLEQWSSQNSSSFTTSDWATGVYTNEGGLGAVQFTGATTIINFVNSLQGTGQIYFSVNGGPQLVWDGSGGGSTNITFYTPTLPETDPTTVTSFEYFYSYKSGIEIDYDAEEVNIYANNTDINIQTNGASVELSSSGDASVIGNQSVSITNFGNTDGVYITTDATGASYQWQFDQTGNLILPRGGVVYETNIPYGGLSGNTIALLPQGGTSADQQLLIYPTVGADANHLHLTSGNLYNTELFLGNDDLYVKLANTGNIVINSNDNTGNTAQWTFGTNSALTLPGGSQLRPLGSNLDIFAGTGSYVNLITSDESSSMGVDNSGGYITTAGGTWNFGTTGNLTAPGNITAGNLDAVNLVISTISSDDSSFVNIADGLNVTGDVISTGFTSTPTAIANLVATVGSRAFINNSNLAATAGWGTQVSGGGSNIVPVWSDGANWYIG
jgi:hypothetical protein